MSYDAISGDFDWAVDLAKEAAGTGLEAIRTAAGGGGADDAAKKQAEIAALAASFVAQNGLTPVAAQQIAAQVVEINRTGDEAGATAFMVRAVTTWNLINVRGVAPDRAGVIAEGVLGLVQQQAPNQMIEDFIRKSIAGIKLTRAQALQLAIEANARRRSGGLTSGITRSGGGVAGLPRWALVATGVAVVAAGGFWLWKKKR